MSTTLKPIDQDVDRDDQLKLPPLLVRASAGTGKTYQLTGRLLSILFSGVEIESILATTFTRKAAGEILNRVLLTLARAASDPRYLADLHQQISDDTVTSDACRHLLHRLLREVHKLRISTLDSFFSQLARSMPFELGLPMGWRLNDEIEEIWLRRRAIDRMLASIEHNELATLVSMLGKGDTIRSIDFELQGIISDGYLDARWQPISAWEKLACPKQPEDSDITLAVGVLSSVKIGNANADKVLQAIADEVVSRSLDRIGGPKIVRDIVKAREGETVFCYGKPVPENVVAAIRVVIELVKSNVLGLLREQTLATGHLLLDFAHHLESLKQQLRVLAFDDVAFRLAKLRHRWDNRILNARLDGSIQHVLLDEFQDTAPVQWAVLSPFAQKAASSSQASFFCVGDVKQAIYGWRGGRAAIFDAITKEIPGIHETSQNLSYRSSPIIMDFVTQVFQNLMRHPKFSEYHASPNTKDEYEANAIHDFAREFPRHESANPALSGFIRFYTAPIDAPDDSKKAAHQEFLRFAAQEIHALELASPERTIGVLTRTNQSLAALIYHLKRLGADVSQEGGNPLTDSAAVELVLSALMLSEHPADLRWAYHISHSPLGKLLGLPPLGPAECNIEMAVGVASDRVRQSIEHRGLIRTVVWLADAIVPSCGQADVQRLRQLVRLAQSYQTSPQPRLSAFVDFVRMKRVERPRPAKVRVMTIHQAKGLEFDAVVLPEMNSALSRSTKKIISRTSNPLNPPDAFIRYISTDQWPLLPTGWRKAFGDAATAAISEALCLMYVALTRPKQALHIIIPPAKKQEFATCTPASLIYHAINCELDPSVSATDLYRSGDSKWNAPSEGSN